MDFSQFHQWVHKELGINLSAYKPTQLNRRIESLMTRLGVKSLEEYTKLIKTDREHRQRFLDFITINVTEFFRNPELFEELEAILKKESAANNSLKIWSAACSIGCEPYSISMILNNVSPNGRHKILATDIDNTILQKAKLGEYTDNEMKNVKSRELEKYFKKVKDKYYIEQNVKNMVTFKKHDLILDSYENNFDLIVCRNVVIYFNVDVKNDIYKRFAASLKKGGLLFVGATESIYNYKDFGFEKASTFIYRKL
ncbi:CheR family methyltransferase [Clostridium folliculivorans]|uniref:protein-glutamate O-methyltransferase n=1 Tax=Clostridium folliculivorans TaxID=2886038 RepID=A0A9W5XYS3_9CLOT|nr:protein-glutamate O-methyltransferase CheR [Clostridium folliculivorans]GKU23544.1 chemotaxis protein CheR [Clostridium folliculivorans]GKU29660.1 chemotaxis protein CheR [Clostridium folliculivorans]